MLFKKWSIFLMGFCVGVEAACPSQPNPPTAWLSNPVAPATGVYIFKPSDSALSIQSTVDALYANNGGTTPSDHGEFSSNRYALLFQPGDYTGLTLDVTVGYYTSVIGLGVLPTDTILSDVRSLQSSNTQSPGALNTFWRSAENFLTKPLLPFIPGDSTSPYGMLWAVSQAAPLRRVVIYGNNTNQPPFGTPNNTGLFLFSFVLPAQTTGYQAGFASGGFMADCQVYDPTGTTPWQIISGSQQQWFTRNTLMSNWDSGVWNMVFLGSIGAPHTTCAFAPVNNGSPGNPPPPAGNPYTTVAATPIIAEKPYISYDSGSDKYFLQIPPIETNKIGPSTPSTYAGTVAVDFSGVYVTAPGDPVANINSAIANGCHVVLSPGIYHLDETIQVDTSNLCILGLGFPTLIPPTGGDPCIAVGIADGVRIAGILLQAGTSPGNGATETLLRWGPIQGYVGNSLNPGFLYDCFARVGGPADSAVTQVQANIMVQINSGYVICDNLWLWRADHDIGGIVIDRRNPCDTAFQVNGDHVTAYGLAAEHTLKNITEWNGENGETYFYQAEYPYDVTQAEYTGYFAYKVALDVMSHHGWGLGVYSFFRDHVVLVPSGILTPTGNDISFTNAATRFLQGFGGISHVINSDGEPVSISGFGPSYVCDYSPSSTSPPYHSRRGSSRVRFIKP